MSLIIPNLRTGNPNQPIYGVSATERAIANLANMLVWLKADDGYFNTDKSKWYDALSGAAYPISGVLPNSGAINGKPGAVFSNTQSVDLGNSFPVNGDFTIVMAVNPTSIPNSGGMVGSKGANWHALYFTTATGGVQIGVSNGASTFADPDVYPLMTPLLIAQTFDNATKLAKIYTGGALKWTSPALAAVTDPTMVLGDIPGLSGTRKLNAVVSEVMIFSRDISKLLSGQQTSDLTTVTTWLKAKYAL